MELLPEGEESEHAVLCDVGGAGWIVCSAHEYRASGCYDHDRSEHAVPDDPGLGMRSPMAKSIPQYLREQIIDTAVNDYGLTRVRLEPPGGNSLSNRAGSGSTTTATRIRSTGVR